MTATVAAAETETEEVEASPATKPHGSVEALTVVGTATEIVIAAVTATEIVAVIVAAIGMATGIGVDILVPGRESKRHQRSVPDWL
jgi:hypothetical protein